MIVTLIIFAFLAGACFQFWRLKSKKGAGVPPGAKKLPGPNGWPLIGSVHELESKNPWMTFHRWGEKYGPLYQVNLGGTNHVWIGDEKIAHDLLSRKGAIYSDRPHIPALLHDNRTSGEYLPLMSKNELWHRQRRFAKHIMTASKDAGFHGYPEIEAIRLMKELLDDCVQYNQALESYVSRVTCLLAWGTASPSDELKQRARELLIGVSPTGALGNKIPWLMALPDKLVPAKAWERKRLNTERCFFQTMQDEVKADVALGRAVPSWMRTFFDLKSQWGFRDDMEGAYAVGMHGIAGALTIAAPMQGWCLAMCHYPKYLPKLQEEIDRVCGDRPPKYSDLPSMPYLRACIREALRWRPAVPTGIPHELTQDDVYNGYLIPAKSVMHPLEWSMSRNPVKYPTPDAYNPERWIDPAFPTYQEPLSSYPTICQYSQFGFGRRVCQGQEVSEGDLFVGIGAMAWAFNISKSIHPETGLEIPVPEMDYTELLIAKPKWFKFDMKPRSEERKRQILALWQKEYEKGSYAPSRQFWDEKNPGLGWSKV